VQRVAEQRTRRNDNSVLISLDLELVEDLNDVEYQTIFGDIYTGGAFPAPRIVGAYRMGFPLESSDCEGKLTYPLAATACKGRSTSTPNEHHTVIDSRGIMQGGYLWAKEFVTRFGQRYE
jgi:hypothetical protein